MKTNSLENTVNLYFDAWNSKGTANITALLKQCITTNFEYVTSSGIFTGLDKMAEIIEQNNIDVPGRSFRLCSNIDGYRNTGRWEWEMIIPNDNNIIGLDIFELDGDGKIAKVTGFFPELIRI